TQGNRNSEGTNPGGRSSVGGLGKGSLADSLGKEGLESIGTGDNNLGLSGILGISLTVGVMFVVSGYGFYRIFGGRRKNKGLRPGMYQQRKVGYLIKQ
ncbi:hypothetical protein C922_05839, partial [Plasmodium inui San Antonio 1]